MEKISKILSLVTKILWTILLLITTGMTFFMGYIMFAPDNFPKPFYLGYAYPTVAVSGEAGSTGGEAIAASSESSTDSSSESSMVPGQGIMLNTGAKIINLAEASGRRYVRITVVVEFAPNDPEYSSMAAEEQATYITEFSAELVTKQPVIDDVIITLVSTKTFEDLYTAEGKEALRQQIMDQISTALPEYHILAVYFSEFVVQ